MLTAGRPLPVFCCLISGSCRIFAQSSVASESYFKVKARLIHLRKSAHNLSNRIFNYEKNYISRRFKYYARKAGLPESIKTHSLRHTFASILAESSIDIHTIKELMGHSSIKVTEIYSHLSPEHKVRAIKKLTY